MSRVAHIAEPCTAQSIRTLDTILRRGRSAANANTIFRIVIGDRSEFERLSFRVELHTLWLWPFKTAERVDRVGIDRDDAKPTCRSARSDQMRRRLSAPEKETND